MTAQLDRPITPALPSATPSASLAQPETSQLASRALAVLRIATGFVFLWAFLDKTFGLGYSTPSERSWINGGSPTRGFLASVDVGPLQSVFHSIAGTWWANGLFMAGLLGIGLALILGVGVRIAAVSGVLLVAGMWLAAYPLAKSTSAGAPTSSTNPLVDDHVLEALILMVLAVTLAGRTWGLGSLWARIPFVARHRWAL